MKQQLLSTARPTARALARPSRSQAAFLRPGPLRRRRECVPRPAAAGRRRCRGRPPRDDRRRCRRRVGAAEDLARGGRRPREVGPRAAPAALGPAGVGGPAGVPRRQGGPRRRRSRKPARELDEELAVIRRGDGPRADRVHVAPARRRAQFADAGLRRPRGRPASAGAEGQPLAWVTRRERLDAYPMPPAGGAPCPPCRINAVGFYCPTYCAGGSSRPVRRAPSGGFC